VTEPNRRRQPSQQRTDVTPAEQGSAQERALARRKENIRHVGLMVRQEAAQLERLLPDHIPLPAFTSAAGAALYKSEKLMSGALNDPEAFLIALREAAMLGHLPGTDHYWLTPRRAKGRDSVLGIEGYQGIVERMYRSGGVLSVHAEIVRENDTFEPYAGPNARPLHQFGGKRGAFSKAHERGPVIGVYAYAMLPGGVPSQLVLLSIEDLMEIKAANPFSDDKSSPWIVWPYPMYKKSALRRLEPYVPVSAGYRQTMAQAQAFIASAAPIAVAGPNADEVPAVVDDSGTVQEGEVVAGPGADTDRPVTDVPYDPSDWNDPGWDNLPVARPGGGVPDGVRGDG